MGSENGDQRTTGKRAGARIGGGVASGGGIAVGIAAVVVVGAAGKLFTKLRRRRRNGNSPDTLAAAESLEKIVSGNARSGSLIRKVVSTGDCRVLPLLEVANSSNEALINGEKASSLHRREHDRCRSEDCELVERGETSSASDQSKSVSLRDSDLATHSEVGEDANCSDRGFEIKQSVNLGRKGAEFERDYQQEPFRRTKSKALRDEIADVISSAFEEFRCEDFSDEEPAASQLTLKVTLESDCEEDAKEAKQHSRPTQFDASGDDVLPISPRNGLSQESISNSEEAVDGQPGDRLNQDSRATLLASSSEANLDKDFAANVAEFTSKPREETSKETSEPAFNAISNIQLPMGDVHSGPPLHVGSDQHDLTSKFLHENTSQGVPLHDNPKGCDSSANKEQNSASWSSDSKIIKGSTPPTLLSTPNGIVKSPKPDRETHSQDRVQVVASSGDGVSVKATIILPDSSSTAKLDSAKEIGESIQIATQIARGMMSNMGPARSVNVTCVTTNEDPSGGSGVPGRKAVTSTIEVASSSGGGSQQQQRRLWYFLPLKVIMALAIVVMAFFLLLSVQDDGVKSRVEIF